VVEENRQCRKLELGRVVPSRETGSVASWDWAWWCGRGKQAAQLAGTGGRGKQAAGLAGTGLGGAEKQAA